MVLVSRSERYRPLEVNRRRSALFAGGGGSRKFLDKCLCCRSHFIEVFGFVFLPQNMSTREGR